MMENYFIIPKYATFHKRWVEYQSECLSDLVEKQPTFETLPIRRDYQVSDLHVCC